MFEAAAIPWACFCALLLACLATWSTLLWRRRRFGHPLIALEPRRPVPWGLVHLLAALLLMYLFERGAQSLINTTQPVLPALRPRDLLAGAGARLAMVFASLLVIVSGTRASALDFGLQRAALLGDLRLGLRTFLMFGPPAYAIQLVLTQWIPGTHPILESLRTAPDARLLAASVVSAVVVAPVQEEFLWRVLFQGWLEKLDLSTKSSVSDGGSCDTTELWVGSRSGSREARHPPGSVPHWPILFSSSLFALLHFNHGPAAAALFVFAVGLGWTYQRTHRILPCVIAHLLLNACSLALLFLETGLDSSP